MEMGLGLIVISSTFLLFQLSMHAYYHLVWKPRQRKDELYGRAHGEMGAMLITKLDDDPISDDAEESPSGPAKGSLKNYDKSKESWADKPEVDDDFSWYG